MAIKYGGTGNKASKYQVFVEKIEEIAKNSNGKITVEEVINDFISDLRNINNSDYNKKISEIEIIGEISNEMLKELPEYLLKVKDNAIQHRKKEEEKNRRQAKKLERENNEKVMEGKWQDLETTIGTLISEGYTEIDAINSVLQDVKDKKYGFDSKERKYITRKLQERIVQANKREEETSQEQARQQQIQKKVEETWKGIQEVASKGLRKKGIAESQYWIAIRDKFEQESSDLKDKDVINQILELFDETIIEKEDNEYFEDVKCTTRDFKSLAFFSAEMMNALYGTSAKKISKKNSERFYNLRTALQQSYNEYNQIQNLLDDKSTTEGDRRILLARKDVMDKEIEKRKAEGR